MARKISDIFEFKGVKLQVVEDFDYEMSCVDCYFLDNDEQCGHLKCCASERKDRKPVKFIRIED